MVHCFVEDGDLVECSCCGKEMLVEHGAEICPICGHSGYLGWLSGVKAHQETNVDELGEQNVDWDWCT